MNTILVVLGLAAVVWWLIVCSARWAMPLLAAVPLFVGCMAVRDGAFFDGLLLFAEAAFIAWVGASCARLRDDSERADESPEVAP